MTYTKLLAVLTEHPSAGVGILLPDGSKIPPHFHVTEVGRVQKDFVDCGGTIRSSVTCVLQLLVADDVEHRLEAGKLAKILGLASSLINDDELPIEFEYETTTVSQFALTTIEFTESGIVLSLGPKHTACLAPDRCGISLPITSCCTSSNCC